MVSRFVKDKNVSQIVFDIHGGEKEFTTMTLHTIPNRQPLIKKTTENYNLRTDDIDGATYKPKKMTPYNFSLNTTDIDGAQPTPYVKKDRDPVNIMSVDDIDGAKPKIQRQLPHSNRMTNPLNPEYQLSEKKSSPPTPPRFLRDAFSNDDIPGAHSKTYKTDKAPKDIMNISDIAGARPRRRIADHDFGNRIYDVSDINNDGIFKSKRVTNPLNPVYIYDGECKAEGYGVASQPPPAHKDNFILNTHDIPGAQHDSSTEFYRSFKRPPIVKEDEEELKPAAILMLPTMKRESAEKTKNKVARSYEFEGLRRNYGTNDPIQSLMRSQRDQKKACRTSKAMPTPSFAPIIL